MSIEDKFIDYCKYRNLKEAKKLYGEKKVNIHAQNECAFRYACWKGHLETAK